MSKRINVSLSTSTVAMLDKVAPRGQRSNFIDRAIQYYVKDQNLQSLRLRLKKEALANAERDLAMATEWFPLEEESWQITQVSSKKNTISQHGESI